MSSTRILLTAVGCLVCCHSLLAAEEPTANQLVEQLGRDEFAVRLEAEEKLVTI